MTEYNLPDPDDMVWVNLSQKEIEELRNKKHELTEYGREQLKRLMRNQEPYPDEMFEEAERREAERKALDALDEIYEKHGDAMLRLTEIEKDNWEREQREMRILERYNQFYNMECSGLPHGTPITPEHQQMITLQSMVDAIRCEYLNREYNEIAITDIEDLIQQLDEQATAFLKKVREFKDSADGVA
jgi:hypothetical protein